jgi:hypothetical protein
MFFRLDPEFVSDSLPHLLNFRDFINRDASRGTMANQRVP